MRSSHYVPLMKKGNTKITEKGNIVIVRYHATDIIKHDKKEKNITLNNGGWLTVTTKRRLNQYFNENNINIGISQKNHTWFISHNGKTEPFENGIVIHL